MRQSSNDDSEQMPGVIATITAGFELTTSHPWLIALPIILDILFWIGPRLSIEVLIDRAQSVISQDPGLTEMANQLVEVASGYNLFTSLSVPLVGIPALMGGISPENSPLIPLLMPVKGVTGLIVLFVLLTLIGLGLAAFYLSLIGIVLDKTDADSRPSLKKVVDFAKGVSVVWLRLLGLGVFLAITLVVILFPLLPIAYMLAFLSQGLSLLVLTIGLVIIITYLSMSVPSIVLDRNPVSASIINSVRMVRKYLLSTMNLLLIVVVIGWGTNLLWHLADVGNWLTMISITGHGYVSTALASAILIFYRDRSTAIIG